LVNLSLLDSETGRNSLQ